MLTFIEIVLLVVVSTVLCVPFVWWYCFLKKFQSLNVIPGPRPLPLLGNAFDVGNTPKCEFLRFSLLLFFSIISLLFWIIYFSSVQQLCKFTKLVWRYFQNIHRRRMQSFHCKCRVSRGNHEFECAHHQIERIQAYKTSEIWTSNEHG